MNDVLTDHPVDETTPDAPRRGLSRKGKIAAAAVTLALLAGGGVAMAQIGNGTTATSRSGPGALGGGGGGRPVGGRAPASGTISAVSATSISVKSSSGTVTTYAVSSATTVQNNGATSTAAKLTLGEKVVVFTGRAPGSTSTTVAGNAANRIMAGTSATQGPGSGAFGGTPPSGTSQRGPAQGSPTA